MRAWLLPLALLAGNSLFARDLPVCVRNQAGVDSDSLEVFERELAGITRISGLRLTVADCDAAEIRITLRAESPVEQAALGAARTAGRRVLPDIEVYVRSVSAQLPARLPSLSGLAMARVAAHEIGHYLLQSCDHGGVLMASGFTGARLIAADRRAFVIPVR